MKSKFTYKNRLRILIAGAVLFFIIVYNMAIKSTVESMRACSNMEEKINMIDEAPMKINLIKKQLASIDGVIDKRDTTQESEIREALLEKTGKYCNKNYSTITELSSPIYNEFKNYQIETNILTLEGSFKSLLKYAYLLEQKYRIGKTISIRFFSEKDFRMKKKQLFMTLYVQNLKSTSNNEKQ